ncbi:MAG: hypothetical protein R3D87_14920 [Paracoccaceae bacterium]
MTQAEAQRLAVAAHDGMARQSFRRTRPSTAICVCRGDRVAAPCRPGHWPRLAGPCCGCLSARAIARAVYLAELRPGDLLPAWRARFATKGADKIHDTEEDQHDETDSRTCNRAAWCPARRRRRGGRYPLNSAISAYEGGTCSMRLRNWPMRSSCCCRSRPICFRPSCPRHPRVWTRTINEER